MKVKFMKRRNKPRTLETICSEEPFAVEILGNVYCSLGMDKKLRCLHHSSQYTHIIGQGRDHNNLYFCLNTELNPNALEILKKYEI